MDGQFGYRLWDPESQKVIRSNDVVFNETKMHKQPKKEVTYRKVTFSDVSPPLPNMPQVNAPLDRSTEQPSTSSQPRRSERVSHPPKRFVPSVDFVLLTDSGELSCYKEAMLAGDKSQWELAMQSEISSIE